MPYAVTFFLSCLFCCNYLTVLREVCLFVCFVYSIISLETTAAKAWHPIIELSEHLPIVKSAVCALCINKC